MGDVLHKRLARLGLVQERSCGTLGELLKRYEETGAVRPSTVAARRQTTNSLRGHFGADTPLAKLTPADADAWRKAIVDSGLATATVSKRVHVARAVFKKAVRWGLLQQNPFADLAAGSQANPDRLHYVTRETVQAVLEATTDPQWRAIIALSRYAGLRCPSELALLRWGDVDWEHGRLTVRSPKTARHEGHAVRVVPIAPELRPILLALFHVAEPGSETLLPRVYDSTANLRTMLTKLLARVGIAPWPRLYHAMRASCAMDWAERFPAHVAASWLGHSPLIAARHYLATRDVHFELAAGLGSEEAAQKAAQCLRAGAGSDQQGKAGSEGQVPSLPAVASGDLAVLENLMGSTGLEPVTSSL